MRDELSTRQAAIRLRMASEKVEDICQTVNQTPQWFHKRRPAPLKALFFSGKPVQIAQAICELTWRRLRRGHLNASDKKLLNQGKEILVTEIAIATDGEQMSVLALYQ